MRKEGCILNTDNIPEIDMDNIDEATLENLSNNKGEEE
jgi:hypothetical protein